MIVCRGGAAGVPVLYLTGEGRADGAWPPRAGSRAGPLDSCLTPIIHRETNEKRLLHSLTGTHTIVTLQIKTTAHL